MNFLEKLNKNGIKKEYSIIDTKDGVYKIDGKEVINFSSNDYLGLSHSRVLIKSSNNAAKEYGSGSCGSRMLAGGLCIHHQLEEECVKFFNFEASVVFSSGFMCNMGILSTLVLKNDAIICDRLSHASLIDGALFSGARFSRFNHNDIKNLIFQIEKSRNLNSKNNIFIVTESVFSMDGDTAPIAKIKEISDKYGCVLIVDESHSIGVFGKNGTGLCSELNIKPDIITATFGKALGSHGGFCLCSKELKSFIVSNARAFIFSTALPPAVIGANIEALNYLKKNKLLGESLIKKAGFFHSLIIEKLCKNKKIEKTENTEDNLIIFTCKKSGKNKKFIKLIKKPESQIIQICFGDDSYTTSAEKQMLEAGFFVKAIKHPTVPKKTSRLRFSICLFHSEEVLKNTSNLLIKIIEEHLMSL